MKKTLTKEDQKQIVANNLSKLLNNKKRTVADVAEAFKSYNIPSRTVYSWFNGEKYPRIDKIQLLADYFDVLKSDITEDKEINTNIVEITPSHKKINLYGSVAAGALAIVDEVTELNVVSLDISPQLLGPYAECKNLFAMKVNGDSMNKVIRDGEIVIAKPQEQFKDGDIVIFSHNNEYSLKRYAPNEIEGFVLFKTESINPMFKDIAIPKNTNGEVKILGRVVFCGMLF